MAFALLFFKIERLASVMPTRSESSLSDIFRRAIITSRFTTITAHPPHIVKSFSALTSAALAITFLTTRRITPMNSAAKAMKAAKRK